jgi:N utilization substance protein A
MSVDLVRLVDSIHRDKNIAKEILYQGIESALATAAKKHYPDAIDIQVTIDPDTGKTITVADGQTVNPPEFGRIAAQTAKQVIIQKIREAERDSLLEEFRGLKGDLITGTVQRFDRNAVTVNLGKTDAFLPRQEQIPGDVLNPGERVRAIIKDVKPFGQRVKITLSRTHADFVRRLFELEIPEIADGVIRIQALAREAGYRSKVAVTSIDSKVDAVGACVGVRGTRIKNIVDELGGERIDIVRWNESLQVLIPNSLQPAEIEEVMLCHLVNRAIVLVREDQLSLAIGRRGQNVRLASKLVGCDIEIMTSKELDELIEKAVASLTRIEGIDAELAERLVEQGILSFDDLALTEIDNLVATIEGLSPELAESITSQADALSEQEQDELPRRKGSRVTEGAAEGSSSGEIEGVPEDAIAQEALELLTGAPIPEGDASDTPGEEFTPSAELIDQASSAMIDELDEEVGPAATGLDLPENSQRIRDFALAEEPYESSGHEVTSPPDESDLSETERIVTDAVEGDEEPPGTAPHAHGQNRNEGSS